MLVTPSSNPAATGPDGVRLVAQAEKLEALLWGQVLTAMSKTAFSGDALGTGSDLLNGVATRALAGSLFGGTDSNLTQQIVGQLKGAAEGTGAAAVEAGTKAASTLSSLAARASDGIGAAGGPDLARAVAYAKSVWPAIKTHAAALGVPPVALLAQSALETGWGSATPGNNLFGIKAHGGLASTDQATTEEVAGTLQSTRARFAAYSSGAASVADYAGVIRRVYPEALGAGSVAQYATALAKGGYATDSGYARKIVATAQSPMMQTVLAQIEGDTE